MPRNAADQLLHTTVRIQCEKPGGISKGTGFFMMFCEDADSKRSVPTIVTNKHVIDGSTRGVIKFTKALEDGPNWDEHMDVIFEGFDQKWLRHPDPNVDLAVLPVGPVIEQLAQQEFPVFAVFLNTEMIANEEERQSFSAIEEIVMIGSPIGLWDAKHNLPIIRRGITASAPYKPFDGYPWFLIDCACFPGSSGSPVLIFNQGSFAQKDGGLTIGSRVRLLGVLWGGPQHEARGELRPVPIPTSQTAEAVSRIPANLGFAVFADNLLWFEEELDRLVSAERQQAEKPTVDERGPASGKSAEGGAGG